jgi:hypothetical protein
MRYLIPLLLAIVAPFEIIADTAAVVVRNLTPLPRYGNGYPIRPHIGDFGGDSAADVLSVVGGHSIQVLISNDPGGVVGQPVITPISESSIYSSATADVNLDGRLDVVFSDHETQRLRIYLGTGEGTFVAGAVLGPQQGGSVAAGDFTGDGRPDLAVGVRESSSSGYLTVYAGTVGGAFAPPVTTPIPAGVGDLTLLEANGDSSADLLVNGEGLWVALGTPSGSFHIEAISFSGAYDLAVGDFDENGTDDFAAASCPDVCTLLTFSGRGDGTFTVGGRYGGLIPFAVIAADVDDDGHLDLISGAYSGDVAVHRGDGKGTFSEARLWHSGHVWSLSSGDVTRDGHVDVVISGGGSSSSELHLLEGSGGGSFDAYAAYALARDSGFAYASVSVLQTTGADVTGDGSPDFIALWRRGWVDAPSFVVLRNANDGAGTMLPPLETGTQRRPTRFAVGDVNGDGKPDIVAVGSEGGELHLGRGDGTFDPPHAFDGPRDFPRLVDVNGDGILDLATTPEYGNSTLYLGTGSGGFSLVGDAGVPIHAFGDLNGDGRADAVGVSPDNIIVGLNDGKGAFAKTLLPGDGSFKMGGLADLNGDSHLDILVLTGDGSLARFGRGDGTFDPSAFTFRISPPAGHAAVLADFNGDGKTDLAVDSTIYRGDGTGAFIAADRVLTHYSGFASADFDGNGTADLAITALTAVSIVRTNTAPAAPSTVSIAVTASTPLPEYGQRVTYTATVVGGIIPVAGAVLFSQNGIPVGLVKISGGTASIDIAHPVGTALITASFAGNQEYQPAAASLTQQVVKATTSVTAYSLQTPRECGYSVRVYAYVGRATSSDLDFARGIVFRIGKTLLNATPGTYPSQYILSGLPPGTLEITAEYLGDVNHEPSSATFIQEVTFVDATIQTEPVILPYGAGTASAPFATAVAFDWTITNGVITGGLGTQRIEFTAGASGAVVLGLTMRRNHCVSSSQRTVAILEPPRRTSFYTVVPCRIIDTRLPDGNAGGPALRASGSRRVSLAGRCGIPITARSVSVNVTVLSRDTDGHLTLFPSDVAQPLASTINFPPSRIRANNAVIALSADGEVTVANGASSPLDFIIDVNGFFE